LKGVRALRWIGLAAGALFGSFGWVLMRFPATEVVGTVLFLFPSLIFGGRGVTDAQSLPFTTCLYALLGFVAGWLLGKFLERRRYVSSGEKR
jgi:hypothetical protein